MKLFINIFLSLNPVKYPILQSAIVIFWGLFFWFFLPINVAWIYSIYSISTFFLVNKFDWCNFSCLRKRRIFWVFTILQRWLLITFADNLNNLGGYCLVKLLFFAFTDLSSALISDTIASCIIYFSSMLKFFLIATILGWVSNF